jgi:hypothetical protein
VSPSGNGMFRGGTLCARRPSEPWFYPQGCGYSLCLKQYRVMVLLVVLGGVEGPVESNERYYRRRAVEERMAAQRAVTEAARAWHAKLAEDFALRAGSCAVPVCTQQTAVSA